MLFPQQDKVDLIGDLIPTANPTNLGDVFEKSVDIRSTITEDLALRLSELPSVD
jgi:hypothetical protein